MPRQDRFFTDKQMQRIRDIPLLGMTTPIIIERRTEATPPAGGDYGDDFLAFPVTSESRRLTVKGWFFSTPTPLQEVDSGVIVTVNTYRLYVPVGTDVLPGDQVRVGADSYTVSDTTAESTWLPFLTCSLRKRD